MSDQPERSDSAGQPTPSTGASPSVAAVPWSAFDLEVPELAGQVRERLEAHRHLVMATLRPDGSPRLSGTEIRLIEGQLEIGIMAGAARLADLQQDERLALHSGSDDPPDWAGDAWVRGRGRIVDDASARAAHLGATVSQDPGEWTLVRVALEEAGFVRLTPDGRRLLVETWRPGIGVRRSSRPPEE